MPAGNWGKPEDFEDAPEVTAACIAVGLPVEQCLRHTKPPHWIKTRWLRAPTTAEKNRAANVRYLLANHRNDRKPVKPAHRQNVRLPTKIEPNLPPLPTTTHLTDQFDASRCQHLAAEIIRQAFADAFQKRQIERPTDIIERDQARNFLIDSYGDAARDREFWCAVADIDATAVRDAAVRRLRAEGEH